MFFNEDGSLVRRLSELESLCKRKGCESYAFLCIMNQALGREAVRFEVELYGHNIVLDYAFEQEVGRDALKERILES